MKNTYFENSKSLLLAGGSALFALILGLYFLMSLTGCSFVDRSDREVCGQGELEVHFLDVGQGDGILLRSSSGATVLIDTGPPSGPFKESLSSKVHLFDRSIDVLVSTHPDADHIGGLKNLMSKYSVGLYMDSFVRSSSDLYLETERMLSDKKQMRLFAYEGMKIRITEPASSGSTNDRQRQSYQHEKFEIDILAPSFEYVSEKIDACISKEKEKIQTKNLKTGKRKSSVKQAKSEPIKLVVPISIDMKGVRKKCIPKDVMETNEMSVVALVTYGENKVILTGDAPVEIEKYIMQKNDSQDLNVDILKAGHHGSKTSTDSEFVRALSPAYSIISAGFDNRYGHPHKSVVETLLGAKSKVLNTGELGTISFILDGEHVGLLK